MTHLLLPQERIHLFLKCTTGRCKNYVKINYKNKLTLKPHSKIKAELTLLIRFVHYLITFTAGSKLVHNKIKPIPTFVLLTLCPF